MEDKEQIKYTYTYSFDEENFKGQYDSKEELIEEVKREYSEIREFWIGKFKTHLSSADYINPDSLIDDMSDAASDRVGEHSDGWLDDIDEKQKESLCAHIADWFDSNGYEPSFWEITDVEYIIL